MSFSPNKTSVEIIKEGAFGGTYFREVYLSFFFLCIQFAIFQTKNLQSPGTYYLKVPEIPVRKPLQNRQIVS